MGVVCLVEQNVKVSSTYVRHGPYFRQRAKAYGKNYWKFAEGTHGGRNSRVGLQKYVITVTLYCCL
uniref:Uncharacterized protein n=1 Tax=Anguilla anguilla TaxID=7936 RepID=A0A0E9TR16_ANGAN